MKPVRYTARDDLEIPAYLTVPKGVEAKNLPTIIVPHGGPWARDAWGYDPITQFLANRGYAVLQPNFRGSTGYGKAFLNAGNNEWGTGAMQHDLTDAVKYLVDEGIADPKRVAIMGGSYGGYATLAGLAFTPHSWTNGLGVAANAHLTAGLGEAAYMEFPYDPPEWSLERRDYLLAAPLAGFAWVRFAEEHDRLLAEAAAWLRLRRHHAELHAQRRALRAALLSSGLPRA